MYKSDTPSKLKILFLLKKNLDSAGYSQEGKCSGLYNSATLLAEELREEYGLKTRVQTVQDGNSVDKELHFYKPNICIIEAIWVTPEKIRELIRIHTKVVFVVRIHSEIPFLSSEGIAIEWIKAYALIPRTIVALNSEDTFNTFKAIGQFPRLNYLPNVYDDIVIPDLNLSRYVRDLISYNFRDKKVITLDKKIIDIGCFGAIRPIKNQLIQAFAAIELATKYNIKLNFHINGTRTEQGGEAILKNLRNLFAGTPHSLVEHPWLDRSLFLLLASQMDVGMQVSFNESFNIVAADFVSLGVPVVVSNAIKWMPKALQVSPVDTEEMVRKLEQAFVYSYLFKYLQYYKLDEYNKKAIIEWEKFLK